MTTFASGVLHDDSIFTAAWVDLSDQQIKILTPPSKENDDSTFTPSTSTSDQTLVEDLNTPTSEVPKLFLASCSVDGNLIFSHCPSLGTIHPVKKLPISNIGIFRLAASSSRKKLAIITVDHIFAIFDVDKMGLVYRTPISALTTWAFSWLDDDNIIACGRNLSIHLISLREKTMKPIPCPGIFSSSAKARFIMSCAISPGKKILAVGTGSGHLILFDLHALKQLHLWKPHTSTIRALVWDNFNHIISGSDDGTICVWSMTGNLIQKIPNSPHKGASILALAVSPKKTTEIRTSAQLENISGSVVSTRRDDPFSDFNPSKTVIATGCSKGRVAIWELGSKDPLATFSQHNGTSLSSLDFDPTGRYLVSSGLDGQLVVYSF